MNASNLSTFRGAKRGILRVMAAVLLGLLGMFPPHSPAADANEFLIWNYDHGNDGSIDMPGRLFVPTGYNPALSYPLVIFYHGLGEVGSDNLIQVGGNIDNLLAAAKSRGFFLYAPQTQAPAYWGPDGVRNSMRMAANALHAYHIDPSRIYVTGLSLGGGGTWVAAFSYTGALAGAVPICGVFDPTNPLLAKLTDQPIWAFHAVDDPYTVELSRRAVNQILTARPEPPIDFTAAQSGSPYYTDGSKFYDKGTLRYSEYSSGEHSIWGRVYNESWMYDWLLSKTVDSNLTPGEEIIFDFGNTEIANPDSQSRFINGTPVGLHSTLGTVIPFASTTAGRSTGTSVSILNPFALHTTGGTSVGAPFDAGVADDGWITPINATDASGAGVLEIKGLLPGGKYRIEIFATAGDDDGGRGRSTRYRIGSEFRNLDAAFNMTQTAVFESVTADAAGVLQLRVFPDPSTGSRYGQINAMQLALFPPDPYQAFRDAYFSTAEQLDDAISGEGADPDGDGLKNVLEYAYLLHPREYSPFHPVSLSDDRTRLEVRFQRDPVRTDAVLELWASENLLSDWVLLAHSIGGAPFEDLTGGLLTIKETGVGPVDVVIQDAVLLADPRRFIRLGASKMLSEPR